MSRTIPFLVIRAVTAAPRSESLNIGLLAWRDEGQPVLLLEKSASRLRALHPNLARLDLDAWSRSICEELATLGDTSAQIAMLPMLAQPFQVDSDPGVLVSESSRFDQEIHDLFERLVSSLPATIRSKPKQRRSRLEIEVRSWLRSSKLYSSRVEDLSRRRVVSHFPVDPATDLYVDFALKNGKLHVIETLDLRGISHVTPGVRGDAAVKSITLAEAQGMDSIGRRIALVHADDRSIAQPAIRLIDRYADDVWHMDSAVDRQSFARFVSDSLHVDQLSF